MITQDVADLVGSKAGHAVLANTSYTFLLRQKPAVISNVAKTFNLSQTERDFLISAQLGAGILLMENDHQELEVIASPEEHRLITTNPDEMIKLSENKKPKPNKEQKEVENAGLDLTRHIYLSNELTTLQKNILANHNYVLKKGHGLESGPHSFYVRPNHPESPEHTLLVGLVAEELQKHTKDIQTYQTKKPDIIFKNKAGQEIVLEIETGKEFSKHKKRLEEKFLDCKQKYRDRVYIILTDMTIKNRYIRFGIPILSRNDMKEFVRLQFSGKKNSYIGQSFNLTKLRI